MGNSAIPERAAQPFVTEPPAPAAPAAEAAEVGAVLPRDFQEIPLKVENNGSIDKEIKPQKAIDGAFGGKSMTNDVEALPGNAEAGENRDGHYGTDYSPAAGGDFSGPLGMNGIYTDTEGGFGRNDGTAGACIESHLEKNGLSFANQPGVADDKAVLRNNFKLRHWLEGGYKPLRHLIQRIFYKDWFSSLNRNQPAVSDVSMGAVENKRAGNRHSGSFVDFIDRDKQPFPWKFLLYSLDFLRHIFHPGKSIAHTPDLSNGNIPAAPAPAAEEQKESPPDSGRPSLGAMTDIGAEIVRILTERGFVAETAIFEEFKSMGNTPQKMVETALETLIYSGEVIDEDGMLRLVSPAAPAAASAGAEALSESESRMTMLQTFREIAKIGTLAEIQPMDSFRFAELIGAKEVASEEFKFFLLIVCTAITPGHWQAIAKKRESGNLGTWSESIPENTKDINGPGIYYSKKGMKNQAAILHRGITKAMFAHELFEMTSWQLGLKDDYWEKDPTS